MGCYKLYSTDVTQKQTFPKQTLKCPNHPIGDCSFTLFHTLYKIPALGKLQNWSSSEEGYSITKLHVETENRAAKFQAGHWTTLRELYSFQF